jgi:hypothetical protein
MDQRAQCSLPAMQHARINGMMANVKMSIDLLRTVAHVKPEMTING